MTQWNYYWKSNNNQIEITLDFSDVHLDAIPSYTSGMGIKMENTPNFIQKVLINGEQYYAFSDYIVVLPNLKKGKNKKVVGLGLYPSRETRLTFVSKRNRQSEKLKIIWRQMF